jgi:hypothetical protein
MKGRPEAHDEPYREVHAVGQQRVMRLHSRGRKDHARDGAGQPLSNPNHHSVAHACLSASMPQQDEIRCLGYENFDALHDLGGQPAWYVHRRPREFHHIRPAAVQAPKRRLAVRAA